MITNFLPLHRTLTLTNPNPNPNNNRNLCGTTVVPEIVCFAIKYSYDVSIGFPH